jgi:hypothetical protein
MQAVAPARRIPRANEELRREPIPGGERVVYSELPVTESCEHITSYAGGANPNGLYATLSISVEEWHVPADDGDSILVAFRKLNFIRSDLVVNNE